MGILQHILGWNWRVRKLRKKWDRLREKSLKKKNPIRAEALKKLDVVTPNLTTLEEQKLSRVDRARISKEVEINLAEVKALLDTKPEEYVAARQFKRMQQKGI
jgi:ribosome-binding ATPase YchF (GTP1/OBG family)